MQGDITDQKDPTNPEARRFFRGSALLLIGRIVAILIKFVVQVLVVAYLSKADYGAFAYALNNVEIGMILVLLAMDRATARFVPLYDEQDDNAGLFGLLVISFVVITGMSAALMVGVIGFREVISGSVVSDPLAVTLMAIMVVLVPSRALDEWIQAIFTGFGSVREVFFRRYLLTPIFQLTVIVLVMLTRVGVRWLAVGYVAGGVIGTLVYASLAVQLFRKRGLLDGFSWSNISLRPGDLFTFSLPMFLSGVSIVVRLQLAVVVLEFFRDTVAVAEYRAVYPLVTLNGTVYNVFVVMYLSVASRLLARNAGAEINTLYWRTTSWIAVVTFPVFLVTFALAQPTVVLLFGEEYRTSAAILSVMALGVYLDSVMGFNKDTLRAYDKIRYLLYVDLVTMAAAVIAYVVFIPRYGALGAAIAFTVVIVLNNILYQVGLVRHTPVQVFDRQFTPIYVMVIVSTLAMALMQVSLQPPFIVGLLVAAVISLVLLRVNSERLATGELFPELLRVPVLGRLLR